MAAPYGNSAVYRGAQRRANMIQNRDTEQQQQTPLQQSLMGTPLETQEEPERVEGPTDASGMQFTLKPYSGGEKIKRPPSFGGNSRLPATKENFLNFGANRTPRAKFGATQPQFTGQQLQSSGQDVQNDEALLASLSRSPVDTPDAGLGGTPTPTAPTPTAPDPLAALLGGGDKPALDSSQWNTEGWGTPGYLGQAAGGAMAGWDQTNWDDPNMQTPKYVVGRILSNYEPSIEGLGQAMQEIQQAYPGAEFDGKDKIIVPGLGTIDVLVNAGGDNTSWAWQDLTNDPGTTGGNADLTASIGQGATDPTSALLSGLDPSLLNDPTWRQLLQSLGIKL